MDIKRPKSLRRIPKHANKVFSGILFDVYHWRQKKFDGTYATFEKLKRKTDTVNVFPVRENGKIILTKQTQPGRKPFIGCLGGRMDEGEDPLTAAKRELLEESGYKASKWKLWFTSQPSEKIDLAIYNFIVKDLEKVKDPEPGGGERIELVEYDFDGFLKLVAKEIYRDKEVSLEIFRIYDKPQEMAKLKKLFLQ